MIKKIKKFLSLLLSMYLLSFPIAPVILNAEEDVEIKGETQIVHQYYKVDEINQIMIPMSEAERQISEEDLYLSLSVAPFENSKGEITRIAIYFHYDWKKIPANRFSDALAIAWDHDDFRLDEDTFEKHDYYNDTVSGEVVEFDYSTRGTSFSPNGVSWDANLPGWHLNAMDLHGFGGGSIVPTKPIKIDRIVVFAEYVHLYAGGSVSFGYENGGISLQNPKNYNSAGIQKTIRF